MESRENPSDLPIVDPLEGFSPTPPFTAANIGAAILTGSLSVPAIPEAGPIGPIIPNSPPGWLPPPVPVAPVAPIGATPEFTPINIGIVIVTGGVPAPGATPESSWPGGPPVTPGYYFGN